jgi:hypothetical protein
MDQLMSQISLHSIFLKQEKFYLNKQKSVNSKLATTKISYKLNLESAVNIGYQENSAAVHSVIYIMALTLKQMKKSP